MTSDKHLLIVGLGNPGTKYQRTRHNIGFLILDALAAHFSLSFKEDKKFAIVKHQTQGVQIHLLKPLEYMNLSGKAVSSIVNLYKIPPEKILVLHDEIDFPFTKIKQKIGGGHAGHNGLRDIIEKMGSNAFHRLRFGVGRPTLPEMDVADYVLNNFTEPERENLPVLIKQSLGIIEEWIKKNI